MGHLGLLARLFSLLSGGALLLADSAPDEPYNTPNDSGTTCASYETFLTWYAYASTCGAGASGMLRISFAGPSGGLNDPPDEADIIVGVSNQTDGGVTDFALSPRDPEFECSGIQRKLTDLSFDLTSDGVNHYCAGFASRESSAQGTSTLTCVVGDAECTLVLEPRP